ncbi:DUF3857 domain-containing protein [Erythrobacter sp.]|uniref:DUF3857 domain-containing protein n=1 Tax=Erythrobacter sp. TaxID=1042 RepID=UPI003263FD8A
MAVLAGETPLYESAPAWVERVDLSELERDPANTILVADTQIRIEKGRRWHYVDEVVRIASAQQLTSSGTVNAVWYPDKGDLIVHDVAIVRGGEVIDVIAQGETFEVLRRERRLEEAVVDGSLTATLFVPGLQICDELRVSYSTTLSDQALGDEVQSQSHLWRKPERTADFARVLVSWPENLDVSYKAWPQADLAPVETRKGYDWLNVELPLAEAIEMPSDAPSRFKQSTLLQVGTFAGWNEVASAMAPHYSVEGALDGLDDLVARVDAIRSENSTKLERAVAALELVQSDVRYLLNGLNGGNYIPQDVATTWDRKYGDCKAKTLILLALLNHLGVEAEPVLVDIDTGDGVQTSLPMPGAFDHVLVRATIDGQLYYLDGTSIGANIELVGNVPDFQFALPIRTAGADLEPIVQVLPRAPELKMFITMDSSAGADLPALTKFEMKMFGPSAAQLNAVADQLTDDVKRQIARNASEEIDIINVEFIKGETLGEATLKYDGISEAVFDFSTGRGELGGESAFGSIGFSPNRSRRDWREVPVAITGPSATEFSSHVILPADSAQYELVGEAQLEGEAAGRRVIRNASLDDDVFAVSETSIVRGGEIAADQVLTERRKVMRLARNELKLLAPKDTPRLWRFAQAKDRSELAKLDAAYDQLVAFDPEKAAPYLTRSWFRYDTYDFAGALADMNKVIEISGTAEYYSQRALMHKQLLDYEAAEADFEEAYALDPAPDRAMELASLLLDMQDPVAARDAIAYEDGDEGVRRSLAYWLAHVDGQEGKSEVGLDRFDLLLLDDPNNASLLNNKCWFMGVWQVQLDQAAQVCTRAVEVNGTSAAQDSRAMVYYRLGRFEDALSDLDEVLDVSPGFTTSLLLRGFVKLELGDKEGKVEIEEALARSPSLAANFRKWGFDL